MNIPTFFSGLVTCIVLSGWGCSVLYRNEESLPKIGIILTNFKRTVSIPEDMNLSNIASQYQGLPCAKDLFPKVPSWEEITVEGNVTDDSGIVMSKLNDLQGCFSVWWNQSSEQKTVGNILWSMSDGDNGTIFLSKVSIDNGVVEHVDENLYFMGKKNNGEGWEILIDRSKNKKTEGETKGKSSDLGSGWATFDLSSPKRLDWQFTNKNSTETCTGKCKESSEWIKEVKKWIKEDSLFLEAYSKYESVKGYFETQE